MIIKTEYQAKGTRILIGKDASIFREICDDMIRPLLQDDLKNYIIMEIILPIIEPASVYDNKGKADSMYVFKDKKGRDLCLRPEATATIQNIIPQLNGKKDVILYYVTSCYRYERPQEGRYREFYQLGVEIINPSDESKSYEVLKNLALKCVNEGIVTDYKTNQYQDMLNNTKYVKIIDSVERGWDYYKEGNGFEIEVELLGTQKQVCGGGIYKGGMGFAIGIDRMILANKKAFNNQNNKYDTIITT